MSIDYASWWWKDYLLLQDVDAHFLCAICTGLRHPGDSLLVCHLAQPPCICVDLSHLGPHLPYCTIHRYMEEPELLHTLGILQHSVSRCQAPRGRLSVLSMYIACFCILSGASFKNKLLNYMRFRHTVAGWNRCVEQVPRMKSSELKTVPSTFPLTFHGLFWQPTDALWAPLLHKVHPEVDEAERHLS